MPGKGVTVSARFATAVYSATAIVADAVFYPGDRLGGSTAEIRWQAVTFSSGKIVTARTGAIRRSCLERRSLPCPRMVSLYELEFATSGEDAKLFVSINDTYPRDRNPANNIARPNLFLQAIIDTGGRDVFNMQRGPPVLGDLLGNGQRHEWPTEHTLSRPVLRGAVT